MRAIVLIALNDLRLLTRDRVGMFWALVFPIVMAVFFGVAFRSSGPAGSLSVILVDETSGTLSREYIGALRSNSAIYLQTHTPADDRGTTRPWTLEAAMNRVRRGEAVAYLRLTDRFTDLRSFFASPPPLELGVDPSRTAETGFLQGIVIQSLFTAGSGYIQGNSGALLSLARLGRSEFEATSAPLPQGQSAVFGKFFDSLDSFLSDADPALLGLGDFTTTKAASQETTGTETAKPGFDMSSILLVSRVERETAGRPRSGYEVTFPSGILWGVVGVVASFAMALVVDRREGTLLRLRVAPLSRMAILSGKALGCFLACILSVTLVLALGVVVYGIRISHMPSLVAAVLCTCFAFVGIMMFIATLGRTEKAVGGGGWALLIVMMMFGGGMIPLIAMPAWMQSASYYSPARWAVYALEGAIWRDFNRMEMAIPCLILLATGFVFFLWGVRRFRD